MIIVKINNTLYYNYKNIAKTLNINEIDVKQLIRKRNKSDVSLLIKHYEKLKTIKIFNSKTKKFERLITLDLNTCQIRKTYENIKEKAYKYMYNPNFDKSVPIEKKLSELAKKKDYDNFCRYIHDFAIKHLFKNPIRYLNLIRKGFDIDDLAHEVTRVAYTRLISRYDDQPKKWTTYAYTVINKHDWNYFIYRSRSLKLYKYKNDTLLEDSIRLASGVGIYNLPEIKETVYLPYSNIIQFIMQTYCMYESSTRLYKALKTSLLLSIGRQTLTLFKLPKSEKNNLIYLINQFKRLILKVNKGKITVERSDINDL